MGTLNDLKLRLEECKGTGRWRLVATQAGCHYYTLARIARGDLDNPGIQLVERLFAALDATVHQPISAVPAKTEAAAA